MSAERFGQRGSGGGRPAATPQLTDRVAGPHFRRPLMILSLLALGACSWFTDFKQQPKIDPWETVADTIPFRGNPQTSVPVYGSAAPGYEYARDPLPATIETMSGIPNPVPADARSLERGKTLFQINCAVCHGALAHGDGPATKYGMVGINLTLPVTQARTDGYIFGMIRNGRGLMPTYNRIEESERWDIVNYVRELQGKLGTIDTTHGKPGENGATVPGPSVTAPQRPAPYYHYVYPQAGALPPNATVPANVPGAAPAANPAGPGAAATPPGTPGAPRPRPATTDTTKKGPQP